MRKEVAQVSVAALVCIAASSFSPALAQSSDGGQQSPAATSLPALDVEASSTKPKKPKKKTAKNKAASPAAVPAAPAPGSTTSSVETAPGANPYADPAAPFKVDRSASAKLTEPLVDTPRTVTAVPKEVLEEKHATSIRELVRTTPGITLGFGEGGAAFGDNIYIRGFRANNDAYIDGVRDPGTSQRESFMIEQVEILKGPGSTINGRGTTGGAINIITKKPQSVDFTEAAVTVGTDETKRTTLDVNRVLDPTFAVRINGMWQDADVAGRDEVFDNRWGGAAAATWTPTTWFKLTADYYHIDLDQMSDWGVPYNNDANAPWPETGLDRSTFYGIPDRDFQTGEQDIGTLTAEIEITTDTTLISKLRRGRTQSQYVVTAPSSVNTSAADPDDWTVGVSYKSNDQITDVYASQTDLIKKFRLGFTKHTLVTGFEISEEKVNKAGYTDLVSEDFQSLPGQTGCSMDLFDPVPPGTGDRCWDGVAVPVPSPNRTYTDISTKAAYVIDTVELTEYLSISGGFRIDDYDISRNSPNATLSRQDTMFNWNAGIVYKPAPNGSIYAAVATSSNPMGQEIEGGGGDYGGLDASATLLDPEENTAYEVGTKWELFDRHLLLTAALFKTIKENARESAGRGEPYTDTGKYYVQGVEFGFAGNVTEAFSLFGGAVLMDSEVQESNDAENVGKKLSNVAHTSFNLLAKYQLTTDLSVGAQATYKSEIYLGTLATNGKVLPDTWRFDLLAEYEITEHAELMFNFQNIFDEVIYDSGYRSGSPFVYVAPGRAAYATIKYSY